MTKSMRESAKQPLPSGPSSLCFNKEEFMRTDFNVETFIVECRRRVQLESLRDDLSLYLKILQSAMIELINKDYADFVNLSTNLVGMDKAINGLTSPLEQLKEEIMNVQGALDGAIASVEVKMNHQAHIRQKKVCLQRLMNIMQSVESMEKLLGIPASSSSSSSLSNVSAIPSEQRSGQLIERVATEFNKLQFYVSKSHGLPLVDNIKPRIANITSTLQYSLEGHFLEGLETGSTDILRQCLRIYATIDKMRNAENLFRKHVVAPFMDEVVNEEFLKGHPHNLKGLYAAVLDFVPQHCKKLQDVTSGNDSGGEIVRGYDFLVNAVWPEVVANIEAHLFSIFAPGNPNVFHQKYTTSMEFVDGFERQCGSQASVKRLRAHPAFNTFMSKWSLPVYFQIRFQEIAGALENAISMPFIEVPKGKSSIGLHLYSSQTMWECLHQCWQSGIYLSPLCHRFWKLTLQLLSRYSTWVNQVHTQLKKMDEKDHKSESTSSSTTQPDAGSMRQGDSVGDANRQETDPEVSMTEIVHLVADVETLVNKVPEMCQTTILPLAMTLGLQKPQLLQESVDESCAQMFSITPSFGHWIMEHVATACCSSLKTVNDIPRLYRRTNREVPSKASAYVGSLVMPLDKFLSQHDGLISDQSRNTWTSGIVNCISEQYMSVTGDVLMSVKKMEESLKRLKRGKGAAAAQQGVSDDDKIRLQLFLDVQHFGEKLRGLDINTSEIKHYCELMEVVESAKNNS